MTPEYLRNLLPPLVKERTHYNLRNFTNIRSTHANTKYFITHSFTIRAWNDLPVDVKKAYTVVAFKYRLNRNKTPSPKYFNAGTRMGHILHARLRMQCSSLNAALHRKNMVSSSSCSWGRFESAFQFIYECPRYLDVRNRYIPDILQIHNIYELLYGKETLQLMKMRFQKPQELIMKFKRFV